MAKTTDSIWIKVPVTWAVRTMRGSIPRNPKLLAEFAGKRDEKIGKVEGILSYRQPGPRGLDDAKAAATAIGEITGTDRQVRSVAEIAEQEAETWPDPDASAMEKMWLTFRQDSIGFFVLAGGIRHHYKDCASSLADIFKRDGLKNFQSKLSKAMYVVGEAGHSDRVYLTRDGRPLKEADEFEDRTMNAITPQGPRSFLQRVDQVANVTLSFTAYVMRGGVVDARTLDMLHEYGGIHGSFQDRSLGHGQYEATSEWPA